MIWKGKLFGIVHGLIKTAGSMNLQSTLRHVAGSLRYLLSVMECGLDKNSEDWRHECEVRYTADQSDEWIRAHLAGVEKLRGVEAKSKLRTDVIKLRRSK